MGTPKKKRRKQRKKLTLKVKVSQQAQLVQKNDKTRVAPPDTLRKAPARLYPENAANFRIKIRKK